MNNNSRSKNTILNFTSSIGGQLLTILMQFVVRTVFIHTLGGAYLGINALFTNILTMLALAEMGVGSAIIYKLYDPLAKKNVKRINILMNFYKKVYRYIGLAISVLGVALIPFLPKLISDYDRLEKLNINAVLIFLLFLANSVSSYLFFAYKSAILRADQKEYYINLIGYLFTIGLAVVQIVELLIFRNFLLYVITLVLKTILENVAIAVFANKNYPFLKEKTTEKLDKKEAVGIFKDCGALFIYKLNNVVVKSTDNIVLSAFLGLQSVALYANYYIFFQGLTQLFNRVYNAVGHSIGNLHTTHDTKKEYSVFESTMMIAAILGGTVCAGIFVVSDEFIAQWIGSDWVLAQPFALLMGLELYTSSFKYAMAKYRTAYGLFKQGWARPLFSMIINLVISLALVKPLGIVGVLIGTLAADWFTFIWYDPLVVHRVGFQNEFPVSRYYLKFAKYTLTTLAVCGLDYLICTNFLTGLGWISVIVHAVICGITAPLAIVLVSFKTPEAKYVVKLAKNELSSMTRKFKKKKKS